MFYLAKLVSLRPQR